MEIFANFMFLTFLWLAHFICAAESASTPTVRRGRKPLPVPEPLPNDQPGRKRKLGSIRPAKSASTPKGSRGRRPLPDPVGPAELASGSLFQSGKRLIPVTFREAESASGCLSQSGRNFIPQSALPTQMTHTVTIHLSPDTGFQAYMTPAISEIPKWMEPNQAGNGEVYIVYLRHPGQTQENIETREVKLNGRRSHPADGEIRITQKKYYKALNFKEHLPTKESPTPENTMFVLVPGGKIYASELTEYEIQLDM